MEDKHAATRYTWVEEFKRSLHGLVEIAVDMHKGEGALAHLVGNGIGKEAREIGCDVRVANCFAHKIDGGIVEFELMAAINTHDVSLIESGEGI